MTRRKAQDSPAEAGQHKSPSPQGAVFRCPHCRRIISTSQVDESEGIATCPNCHLPIDEVHRA